MDLTGIGAGIATPDQPDPEVQAQHAAAPTTEAGTNAKTIVLSLAGFMVIFYMLHVVERWAVKA